MVAQMDQRRTVAEERQPSQLSVIVEGGRHSDEVMEGRKRYEEGGSSSEETMIGCCGGTGGREGGRSSEEL